MTRSGVKSSPNIMRKKDKPGKIRVAAYCRVSKDIEEQKTSMQTQIMTYDRVISENPDWEIAGIYADRGKTGTNMLKRPEFKRMVADAKAGKIDLILVKSASRFSRNTVDLLNVTRELKNRGVGVYFEKENINTLQLQSEMLLTVYAAFAQEESRSISENVKRGIRQRFEIGIPKYTAIYGLKRNSKNEWVIVEKEAEIIRMIFQRFIEGDGIQKITDSLNELGIPGPNHNIGEENGWYTTTIEDMLKNEKYAGDCLMQKYYTVDHLSHKSILNDKDIVRQYYAEDHHPAIISKETFVMANQILLMKDCHRGANQYPYYGKLICPFCGSPMVKAKISTGVIPSGWICGGENRGVFYKERTDCEPYWIKEPYLTNSVRSAIMGLGTEQLTAIDAENVLRVQSNMRRRESVEYIDLDTLVESMTFPDWDTLEVTWRWGAKSLVKYEVERPVDYACPEIRFEDGKYMVGQITFSSKNVIHVRNGIQKCRDNFKRIQIISDEDKPFPCSPIIRVVKEKRQAKERKA